MRAGVLAFALGNKCFDYAFKSQTRKRSPALAVVGKLRRNGLGQFINATGLFDKRRLKGSLGNSLIDPFALNAHFFTRFEMRRTKRPFAVLHHEFYKRASVMRLAFRRNDEKLFASECHDAAQRLGPSLANEANKRKKYNDNPLHCPILYHIFLRKSTIRFLRCRFMVAMGG